MNYKKLRKENLDLINDLDYVYYDKAKDLENFFNFKLKTEVDREIVMYDILNMLTNGYRRGEKIENIIGEDIKEFANGVLESYKKPNILEIISDGIMRFSYLIIIYILPTLLFSSIDKSSGSFFNYMVTINMREFIPLGFGLIIGGIFFFILFKFISPIHRKVTYAALGILILALIIVLIIPIKDNDDFFPEFFYRDQIIRMNLISFIIINISLVGIIAYSYFWRNNKIKKSINFIN